MTSCRALSTFALAILLLQAPAAEAAPGQKLADFVLSEECAGKALHGVGHGISHWDSEFMPYVDAVPFDPVVFSGWLTWGSERYWNMLTSLRRISDGYEETGSTTARQYLVPLIGIDNRFSAEEMDTIAALIDAGLVDTTSWETIVASLHEHGVTFKDEQIIAGELDEEIIALAQAVAITPGPVLIRLMHEFAGGLHSSHIAGPETMRQAWIHFVDLMRASGADNAEFVMHANTGDWDLLDAYWPGDEHADWVASSLFDIDRLAQAASAASWAETKGTPFMLAEACPCRGAFADTGTADPAVWDGWFAPFFQFIDEHPNMKMFVYSNLERADGEFSHWPDTRIQGSQAESAYADQMYRTPYLHGDEMWQTYGVPPARFRNPLPAEVQELPGGGPAPSSPDDGAAPEPTGAVGGSTVRPDGRGGGRGGAPVPPKTRRQRPPQPQPSGTGVVVQLPAVGSGGSQAAPPATAAPAPGQRPDPAPPTVRRHPTPERRGAARRSYRPGLPLPLPAVR